MLTGERICRILEGIDSRSTALTFIRHSIRGPIEGGSDVPLTGEGEHAAEAFGERLPGRQGLLVSASPRIRCTQTAKLIAQGYSATHQSAKVSMLDSTHSLAGILHSSGDSGKTSALLKQIETDGKSLSVAEWHIDDELRVYAESLANSVLHSILSRASHVSGGSLIMFVDHDLHLLILREHLTGSRFESAPQWIDFLDGFVAEIRGGSLVLVHEKI